jgi:hypothetical protein
VICAENSSHCNSQDFKIVSYLLAAYLLGPEKRKINKN